MDREQFLTTGDAARKLNVSSEYVRRLTLAGKLSATRTVSGQYLFEESDLERFARKREADRRKRKGLCVICGDHIADSTEAGATQDGPICIACHNHRTQSVP